jgi:NitT/TauT family transport system permease protein
VLELYLAWERVILGSLVIVVVLTAWEGLNRGWWADLLQPVFGAGAERLRIRPIFVSSPTLVAQAAWRLYVVTGEIWPHLATSALEYVVGIAFAIAIGVPFGLVAGWYRRASYVVEPFITALNATPQVAFLPLLVIWIGTGFTTRVTIIFLLSVLPILIASMAAVRTLDRRFLKLAQSFAAPQWHTFLHLVLPSSVPFILGGVRLAIGRAMIGIVVGELYGAAIGLGLFINRAGSLFQTDKVFVGVITIIAAGLVLTGLLRRIERRFDAWRPTVGGA